MIVKSYEEILTLMLTEFEKYLGDNTVVDRNPNNIVYNTFRGIAKGEEVIHNSFVAITERFNPLACDEGSLLSLAKIAGVQRMLGSCSGLNIVAYNSSNETAVIPEGDYLYTSIDAVRFTKKVISPITIQPGGSSTLLFMSESVGAFRVMGENNVHITGAEVGVGIVFSTQDNISSLGYEDESIADFRQRIASSGKGQDAIEELETTIRNKNYVFDCSFIYNKETTNLEIQYGSETISLPPYNLLFALSGEPREEIGKDIARLSLFSTFAKDAEKYILYSNPALSNGGMKFYYVDFAKKKYSVTVTVSFSAVVATAGTVESSVKAILSPLQNTVRRVSHITEKDIYEKLDSLNIPTLVILNVDLKDSVGATAPYLSASPMEMLTLDTIEVVDA